MSKLDHCISKREYVSDNLGIFITNVNYQMVESIFHFT